MSQLPPGTKASRSFVEGVAVDGAMNLLIAWQSWIALPIIRQIFESAVEKVLVVPTMNFVTAAEIARQYVTDQAEFDKQIIALEMLEQQNPTDQEREEALEKTQESFRKYIRRGSIT